MATQTYLSDSQIDAFDHTGFVDEQIQDFRRMVEPSDNTLLLDVGGGCGYFARGLIEEGYRVRVMDMDRRSIDTCHKLGFDARVGDALNPEIEGDETVVSFNLVLHHLVGANERATRALQVKALRAWQGRDVRVFVNEYIYQSFLGQVSPRLIYQITSSKVLSLLGRLVSKVFPAFRANTFGVGVRFRSHEQWRELFAEAGFKVTDAQIGKAETFSPLLRVLLIKTIRRDSFLLESAN